MHIQGLLGVKTRIRLNADARVNRTIREADERIARLRAEAQNRIGSLQRELAQGTRGIDQVKAEADSRIERIEIEANARVAGVIFRALSDGRLDGRYAFVAPLIASASALPERATGR